MEEEETQNVYRLIFFLIESATIILKEILDRRFTPQQLQIYLERRRRFCDEYRHIPQVQEQLLFPTEGCPDTSTFDISLLVQVIKSSCSRQEAPTQGWKVKSPRKEDTSLGADLLRIREKRNNFAHQYHKKEFEEEWRELKEILLRLADKINPTWRQWVEEKAQRIRNSAFVPLECIQADEQLNRWDKQEEVHELLNLFERVEGNRLDNVNILETNIHRHVDEVIDHADILGANIHRHVDEVIDHADILGANIHRHVDEMIDRVDILEANIHRRVDEVIDHADIQEANIHRLVNAVIDRVDKQAEETRRTIIEVQQPAIAQPPRREMPYRRMYDDPIGVFEEQPPLNMRDTNRVDADAREIKDILQEKLMTDMAETCFRMMEESERKVDDLTEGFDRDRYLARRTPMLAL